jgi:hypothetical protein
MHPEVINKKLSEAIREYTKGVHSRFDPASKGIFDELVESGYLEEDDITPQYAAGFVRGINLAKRILL